jgi:hypothetical protein
VVGYLYNGPWKDREVHKASDSAGDPEQILRVIGQEVRKFKMDRVEFMRLPFHSPLARRIREGEYSHQITKIMNDGRSASMIRLIDLRSILEKTSGLLADRLKNSHLAGWTGTISIEAAEQSATLSIGKNGITAREHSDSEHVIAGGQEVAQLIVGTEEPHEVCESGGINLSGDAAQLVSVLFPAQRPQMPNEEL